MAMRVIFKEYKQSFSLDADFFDTFIISQYYYRPPLCPEYLAGIENYRGELFPILSLSGLVGSKNEIVCPKYLLLLNGNFSVMLHSITKPTIMEDNAENIKVDIKSEFEQITKSAFMISGEVIYELDMKKVSRKIADFQKKHERN